MPFLETTIGNIPDSLPAFTDDTLLETEWNPGGGPIGYKATALQMSTYVGTKIDLQTAYNVGNEINLAINEPLKLISTVAGMVVPQMSDVQFDAIPLPDNGLYAWNQGSSRFRVNKGSDTVPLYDEVAYLSDINIATTSNFGEMFFNNNLTATTIVTPGVPVKITATYSSGLVDNFSQATGTLTYDGADTKTFKLSATVSVLLTATTDQVSVLLAVNGSVVAKSKQSSFIGSATNAPHEITVQSLVSLNSTDTVEVFIQNDDDTSDIVVENLNCTVTQSTGTFDSGSVDLQVAYNNGNGQINAIAGKPFGVNSTVAGVFDPSMTEAQFMSIGSPLNGLHAWANDTNRFIVNAGTPGSPVYENLAYSSDLATVDLQTAYDNGNVIQLVAGVNLIVNDNAASPIFEVQETTFNTRTWDTAVIRKDSLLGPNLEFENLFTGSVGLELLNVNIIGAADNDDIKGFTPIQLTVLDSATGSYSTSFIVRAYDNNSVKDYISIDGSADTISVPNSVSGTLDEVATLSDLTLQNVYDLSVDGDLTLASGEPLNLISTVAGFSLPSMTNVEFDAIATPLNGLQGWSTDDNRIRVNKGTPGAPVYDSVAYLSDTGGGATVSSGDPAMTVFAEINTGSTSISSQFYQRIDDIVYVQAEISTTPTFENASINLTVPFTGNFTNGDQANGDGTYLPITGSSFVIPDVQVLGTVLTPTTGYPKNGTWVSVIDTLDGTKEIPANTFDVGNTYEITITGVTNTILTGGSGQLRIIFGGAVLATSDLISSNTNGLRAWSLTYRVTVVSPTTIRSSSYGAYQRANSSNDFRNDAFRMYSSGLPVTFNPLIVNNIDVEYSTVSAAGNSYEFIAQNLEIKKYVAPTQSAGSGTLSSVFGVPTTSHIGINFDTSDQNLNKQHRLLVDFSYEIQ